MRENVWNFKWLGEILRVNLVIFGGFGPSYVRMSMVVAIYNPIFWWYATYTLNIRAGVLLVCELGWCRYSKNVNLSLVRSNAVRVKMIKNEGCRKWIKSWFLERSRWVEHRGVICFENFRKLSALGGFEVVKMTFFFWIFLNFFEFLEI